MEYHQRLLDGGGERWWWWNERKQRGQGKCLRSRIPMSAELGSGRWDLGDSRVEHVGAKYFTTMFNPIRSPD